MLLHVSPSVGVAAAAAPVSPPVPLPWLQVQPQRWQSPAWPLSQPLPQDWFAGAQTQSFLGAARLPPTAAVVRRSLAAGQPAAASAAARFFLQRPGYAALTLREVAASKSPETALETHYFQQTYQGIPIEGAYALSLGTAETIRYARQHLVLPPQGLPIDVRWSAAQAIEVALQALQPHAATVQRSPHEAVSLRLLYVQEQAHVVWRVPLRLQRPWGAWAVFIDAQQGTLLATRQSSHNDVRGHVSFTVEPLCSGDTPKLRSMPRIMWQRGPRYNSGLYTDARGNFSSAQNIFHASVYLRSPFVELSNASGQRAGPWNYALAAAPADNSLEIDDAPFDQIDAFYHVHQARAWLLKHAHNLEQRAWAQHKLEVQVNLPDACNAYYDGGLHFFNAGNGCLNTGRSAAVIYHEYGHGIHEHSSAEVHDLLMDAQVSEGVADYIAATLTNNPNMRGLWSCDDNFRSCANTLSYCPYGCDMNEDSEVHDAGQVLCGAWWELRHLLSQRYGVTHGKATTDRLFLRFLSLVGDMDSVYQAAIAADDDDDSNPRNGTRHSCEINRAFAEHHASQIQAHFMTAAGLVPCQRLKPFLDH